MSRSIQELKNECQANGLVVYPSGKREAKKDFENALRKFYWNRDFPGQKMPDQVEPMLARNAKDLPESEVESMLSDQSIFVAQEKLDGCRMILQILPTGNYITSRRISDKTYRMAENQDQVAHLRDLKFPEKWLGAVIDGEMVCPKDEVQTRDVKTANQLQACVALLALEPEDSNRIQAEQDCQLIYRVFDMLKGPGGEDLTYKSYATRLHYLQMFQDELNKMAVTVIQTVPIVTHGKKEFYEDTVRKGGEGIMLKSLTSTYCATGRPASWFKMKRFESIDGWVSGFIPAEEDKGFRGLVGALEVSVYDQKSGKPVSIAMVPNMTLEERRQMTETIDGKPALKKEYYDRVVEVRGQEFSARKRHLVHARLMRWREGADAKAKEACIYDIDAMIATSEGKFEVSEG